MNKFRTKQLKEKQMFYILLGSGIVVLIIFFAVFFPKNPKADVRLKDIEERLVKLEGSERLARIEDKLTRLERTIPLRVEHIEKELNRLQARLGGESRASITTHTGTSYRKSAEDIERTSDNIKEKKAIESKPKNISDHETVKDSKNITKAQYHEIHPGETLYHISRRYGIKVEDLLRLNNLDADSVIRPGQKLLISPEKNE